MGLHEAGDLTHSRYKFLRESSPSRGSLWRTRMYWSGTVLLILDVVRLPPGMTETVISKYRIHIS